MRAPLFGDGFRARGHIDRLRQRDLKSEGEKERSRFGRRRASGIETQTRLACQGRHLIAGNDNRMAGALVSAALYVLSHEGGTAQCHRPAVVTPRHAWRRVGALVIAAGSRGFGWVAPHFAQKRGVLAHAHHQNDRENSGSKHVTPATSGGKGYATVGA